MTNPYTFLGLDAVWENVKTVYHKLALWYHQDRNPPNLEKAHKAMAKINAADDQLQEQLLEFSPSVSTAGPTSEGREAGRESCRCQGDRPPSTRPSTPTGPPPQPDSTTRAQTLEQDLIKNRKDIADLKTWTKTICHFVGGRTDIFKNLSTYSNLGRMWGRIHMAEHEADRISARIAKVTCGDRNDLGENSLGCLDEKIEKLTSCIQTLGDSLTNLFDVPEFAEFYDGFLQTLLQEH